MTRSHSVSVFQGSLSRFIAKAALETIGFEALSSCAAQSAWPLAVKARSSSFSLSQSLYQLVISPQPFIPLLYQKCLFSRQNTEINITHDEKMLKKHSNFGLTMGKVLKCLGQPSNRLQHTIWNCRTSHRCQPALHPGLKNLQTEETLQTHPNCCYKLLPCSGHCRSLNSRKAQATTHRSSHRLSPKQPTECNRTCGVSYSSFVQRLHLLPVFWKLCQTRVRPLGCAHWPINSDS